MAKKKASSTPKTAKTRALPVKMPISFGEAIKGLLAVKPEKKNITASKKLPKRGKKRD